LCVGEFEQELDVLVGRGGFDHQRRIPAQDREVLLGVAESP
jgi:hypothetical protein